MRAYLYSNLSKSIGVENKVKAQAELLEIKNIIAIKQKSDLQKLYKLKNSTEIYIRESLLISILSLYLYIKPGKKKIIVEANRGIGNISGRRPKFILTLRAIISKPLFKKCDKIICVSEEIKNSFPDNLKQKCIFVPNIYRYTIDNKENVPSLKKYDILFMGSALQIWQEPKLIEEFAKKYPQLKILHIGEGVFKANNISDIGYITNKLDLEKQIKECEVAVSQLGLKKIGMREAYPLKHAELVSCDIPIISGAFDQILINDPAYAYLEEVNTDEIYAAYERLRGRRFDKKQINIKIKHHLHNFRKIFDVE